MAILDELVNDAIKQHNKKRTWQKVHASGYTKEIIYYFAHAIHDNQHFTCAMS